MRGTTVFCFATSLVCIPGTVTPNAYLALPETLIDLNIAISSPLDPIQLCKHVYQFTEGTWN